MKNTIAVYKAVAVIAVLICLVSAGTLEFDSHVLFTENSGSWAQTGVADFDNDGKLDFAAGNRGGIYWWKNPGDLAGDWNKHTIIDGSPSDVGGEAMDVDGDGWMDWVSSEYWYKNTGNPVSEKFTAFKYGESRKDHDVDLVDIDGDGRLDVLRDHNDLMQWAKMPPTDQVENMWTETEVVRKHKGESLHGAVSPKGWGDVDQDGDMDIVSVQLWFENVDGEGKEWTSHEYTSWGNIGPYGWEFRTWVDDLDGDGDPDFAISEGDHPEGRAAWVENTDGKAGQFETHQLPLGFQGDMHSIASIDFDQDGDIDIFTAKNAGGNGNPWVIFENMDGKATFEKRTIYTGYGAHETVYADFDGDRDMDMVSKCWCSPTTFVLLENRLDPPLDETPPSAPSNVAAEVTDDGHIIITWTTATDEGTGVDHYTVFRNGEEIGTSEGTEFTDNTAVPGVAYEYTVSATDGANLEGEQAAATGITAVEKTIRADDVQVLAGKDSFGRVLTVHTFLPETYKVGVYTVRGKRIALWTSTGPSMKKTSLNGNEGVIIVRVESGNEHYERKIMVAN
jgi:hypothetical protein